MRKRSLYIILVLSLMLNVLYFKYDTFDYLWPKIKKKYFPIETIDSNSQDLEKTIVNASLEMLSYDPVMIWNEHKGLTETLLYKNNITSTKEFRLHNYPRAFLFYGLSEYLVSNLESSNNRENLLKLKSLFDKLYDLENIEGIKIQRIDQVPFGLTALNLYQQFKEEKYLKFSKLLLNFINTELMDDEGIVSYRKNQQNVLNDMLGMIGPFLIKYDEYDKKSHLILKNQLDYFTKYGVDNLTHIPAHAVNKKTKTKVGSINWGRGIGWYLIAICDYNRYTNEFQEETNKVLSSINNLKNTDGLWTQFPGSSDRFDSSTSTMFLYSMIIANKTHLSKEEVFKLLKKYISLEGEILEMSGDTYATNNYSKTFGKSELSQGMLLLILANTK